MLSVRLRGEDEAGQIEQAERTCGELLKRGIRVIRRTIQKYLRQVLRAHPPGRAWATSATSPLTRTRSEIWRLRATRPSYDRATGGSDHVRGRSR